MELLRDLIRDLVGIIFPGSLIVIFTIWLLWGVFLPFNTSLDSSPVSLITSANNFAVLFALLIFSYVAGQLLRIRQLNDVERKATERSRKDKDIRQAVLGIGKIMNWQDDENAKTPEAIFEKVRLELNEEFSGEEPPLQRSQLEAIYRGIRDWEEFPYPYTLRIRSKLWHPPAYFQFFRKYDEQKINTNTTFFNYCKSVAYEYSPSFKEELIRQEALVRLLAGIYYALKFGFWAITPVIAVHFFNLIIKGIFAPESLIYDSSGTLNLHFSVEIVIISTLSLIAFGFARADILKRIRRTRLKEANMAFDAFYICSIRNKELWKLHES